MGKVIQMGRPSSEVPSFRLSDRVLELIKTGSVFEKIEAYQDDSGKITNIILRYSPFAAYVMGLLYPAYTEIRVPPSPTYTISNVATLVDEQFPLLCSEVVTAMHYAFKDYNTASTALDTFFATATYPIH